MREDTMTRTILIAAAAIALSAGAAFADPIEGNWKTEAGSTAQIASCGGRFCITLVSGEHKGKQIGKMQADGGAKYSGQITDPSNNKTYKGKASITANALKMSGCVLGGLICKSQTWQRM
jgi:uncharacterized protein (DUF2147 family)